jgi:hypothetical protein
MDVVMEVRNMYWVNRDWTTKNTHSKVLWLVIALGFDSGPRIGNLILKDGKDGEDHRIRAGHTTFQVKNPPNMEEVRIKGGPRLTKYLERKDVTKDTVLSVDMVFITSKIHRKVKSHTSNPKVIQRRTPEESLILDDLLEWFLHSLVQEGDELLTRYSVEGK